MNTLSLSTAILATLITMLLSCNDPTKVEEKNTRTSDIERKVSGNAEIKTSFNNAHTGFALAGVSQFALVVSCEGIADITVTQASFQLPIGSKNCIAKLANFAIGNNNYIPSTAFTTYQPPESAIFVNEQGKNVEARVIQQLSSDIGQNESVRYEIWGVKKSTDLTISVGQPTMSTIQSGISGDLAPSFTPKSASFATPTLELLVECDVPTSGANISDAKCAGEALSALNAAVDNWRDTVDSPFLSALFQSTKAKPLDGNAAFVAPGDLGLVNGGFKIAFDMTALMQSGKLSDSYIFALNMNASKSYVFAKMNVSAGTPPVVPPVTPPPGAEPKVTVIADASVNSGSTGTNYGSATTLETDLGPDQHVYIKFKVEQAASITSAVLRLHVTNGTSDGPKVYGTSNNWEEDEITWDNMPPANASLYSDIGAVDAGDKIEINVLGAINGDGNYSLVLIPDSSNGMDISSLQGSTAPVILVNGAAPMVPGPGPGPAPDPNADPNADAKAVRGPYLQMGSSTAMTIRWRTDVSTDAIVNYGTSPTDLTSMAKSASAGTKHEVRLTGLQPSTKYYYSIANSKGRIAGATVDHSFVTFPPAGSKKNSRIWVLGDAGTANSNQKAVRDAYYSYTGATPTDLWLMLGDNAYGDGKDSEYQEAVFDIYQKMLIGSSLFPTRGNHERDESPFYEIFTMPTQGESGGYPSGSERYYSFDYANIHFVCLDSVASSTSDDSAMITWLKADLSNTMQEWVIAFWHHSPYSDGSHGDNKKMKGDVVPVMESYGVDLVLTGHSHGYERSYLIDNGKIIDAKNGRIGEDGAYSKPVGLNANQGAVYIVAGSSGKTSSGGYNHPLMYISMQQLGSVVLDVSDQQLDLKFLRETGAIDDQFTIIKQ